MDFEYLDEPIIETSNHNTEMNFQENLQELEKIRKLSGQKHEFAEELKKQSHPQNENKIKILLQQADQYAQFLLQNQKQKKINKSAKKGKKIDSSSEQSYEDQQSTFMSQQPQSMKNGQLKEFQIIGLNWLISLYEIGINGILADEMGLGKTVQTISLIAFLREYKNILGPFLIIAPKSTLGNWFKEFQKWLPNCRVLKLVAIKEEREELLKHHLKPGKFDVCLTSYEGVNICQRYLNKFEWKYMIIDEAHKIKNEESLLSMNVRSFNSAYKLLLTGTPLQNNLHELWSLLNFLMPDIFDSSEIFDNLFNDNQNQSEDKNLEIVRKLHQILKPFMLRRTKAEVETSIPPKKEIYVYTGLTKIQQTLYKNILMKKNPLDGDNKNHYLNLMMQLRKVCNHPYLFDGVEEEDSQILGEHLVQTSGKMLVLDKLLSKLWDSNQNHQVLIFSQMTRILDILEDYMNLRKYKYNRIDGDTSMESRDEQIQDFTKKDSEKFIFLLSTRAGGLGINLMTADTVILYDSDWNPQADLQAMDRAHRIGQNRQVNVYRFITEHTIEEKIIERQIVKIKLDQLCVNKKVQNSNKNFSKDQLKDIVSFGVNQIFKGENGTFTDEDIDALLKRGEEKASQNQKEIAQQLERYKNILDLSQSNFDYKDYLNQANVRQEDAQLFEAIQIQKNQIEDEDYMTRRERKMVNEIRFEQDYQNLNQLKQQAQKVKYSKLYDHHLHVNKDRLLALLNQQAEFKANVSKTPLTQEEKDELQQLQSQAFQDWSLEEYKHYIKGCERYIRNNLRFGRNQNEQIQTIVKTKTLEQVQAYSKAFWERINQHPEYERIIKQIEKGESQIQDTINAQKLIIEKLQKFKNPKEEFKFTTSYYSKFKDRFFTNLHDRILLYYTMQNGFGNWEDVKKQFKQDQFFQFDIYVKSRNEQDISKRVKKLIKVLEKEVEEESKNKKSNEKKINFEKIQQKQQNGHESGQKNNNNKSKSDTLKQQKIQVSFKRKSETNENEPKIQKNQKIETQNNE